MIRGATEAAITSVSRIVEYLRDKVAADPNLRNVRVRGEVTNYMQAKNGHLYFALKEGTTLLPCVAWAQTNATLPAFENGAAVVASGLVSVYPQRGSYQLDVKSVEIDGQGEHHKRLEALKKRLTAEGLFDPARKRALPAFPFRVAVVSSRKAAGGKDFAGLLHDSRPHIRVRWLEARVQGASAPAEIAGAIGRASREEVDLIVLTRGGGSTEDLVSFNDERVVRAVVASRHPVISAIGHTVDQVLSDYAADRHADTPSAAVEMLGPKTREMSARIRDRFERARGLAAAKRERGFDQLDRILVRSRLEDIDLLLKPQRLALDAASDALENSVAQTIRSERERVSMLAQRLEARDPSRRLREREGSMRGAIHRLELSLRLHLQRKAQFARDKVTRLEPAARSSLNRVTQRSELLRTSLYANDPEAILQRGYAIVTRPDGSIVRNPADVPIGEIVSARVARGTLSARVETREIDGNERVG